MLCRQSTVLPSARQSSRNWTTALPTFAPVADEIRVMPNRGVDPVLKVGGGRGTNLYIHICMYFNV